MNVFSLVDNLYDKILKSSQVSGVGEPRCGRSHREGKCRGFARALEHSLRIWLRRPVRSFEPEVRVETLEDGNDSTYHMIFT